MTAKDWFDQMLSRFRAILPAPSMLMKRPSGWIQTIIKPGTI
jgi:hypothetical protein